MSILEKNDILYLPNESFRWLILYTKKIRLKLIFVHSINGLRSTKDIEIIFNPMHDKWKLKFKIMVKKSGHPWVDEQLYQFLKISIRTP